MKKNSLLLFSVGLVFALLACALPTNLSTGDGSLAKDDFSDSDSGWGTGADSDSSVEYAGGELVLKLFKSEWFVQSPFGDKDLENIHVEVIAKNTGGGVDTAFGIVCHHQVTSSYYYMGITAAGDYMIAKTAVAKDDVFLTNNDAWAASDQITPGADSYRLGADCGNGGLTLYVDGKQIDSAQDSSYTHGEVGLFAWTLEDTNSEIRFDDFVVTSLTAAK